MGPPTKSDNTKRKMEYFSCILQGKTILSWKTSLKFYFNEIIQNTSHNSQNVPIKNVVVFKCYGTTWGNQAIIHCKRKPYGGDIFKIIGLK